MNVTAMQSERNIDSSESHHTQRPPGQSPTFALELTPSLSLFINMPTFRKAAQVKSAFTWSDDQLSFPA